MKRETPSTWHVWILGAMTAFGTLLLYLWSHHQGVHESIQHIDTRAYLFLDSFIAVSGPFQVTIAFASSRPYAILTFLALAGVIISFCLFSKQHNFVRRVSLGLVISFFTYFLTEFRRRIDLFEMHRPSPSLVLDGTADLVAAYPEWWSVKVISHSSFPSDHATAIFLIMILLWRFAGARWGSVILALLPFILLPRLMVGAHWLSDMAIGSVMYVSLVAGWVLCTPLVPWLCVKVEHQVSRAIAFFRSRGLVWLPE